MKFMWEVSNYWWTTLIIAMIIRILGADILQGAVVLLTTIIWLLVRIAYNPVYLDK